MEGEIKNKSQEEKKQKCRKWEETQRRRAGLTKKKTEQKREGDDWRRRVLAGVSIDELIHEMDFHKNNCMNPKNKVDSYKNVVIEEIKRRRKKRRKK